LQTFPRVWSVMNFSSIDRGKFSRIP